MSATELSILIPSRNEMFLKNTVENILENIESDTEVLVALDGEWAEPALNQHPRVTVIYFPESVGQRAATNALCKLSKAKYVMKVDAHCSFDKGFDRKLIEDMQDDWTVVPLMKNLHAFDWVCKKCGNRWYQGPTPTHCCSDGKGKVKNDKCDSTEFYRDIKWRAKPSPNSTSYRFDKTLHFQYWGDYKKKQKGDLVETMSLQGSCFMLTRKKYWELDISSEEFRSWGQQGVEVACKTWLSGGRVICNKKTWYAHMFRTQGGDFSFPYPNKGSDVEYNRKLSRDLFINNKWKGAKRDFQWLINKFNPPEWGFKKEIIYYTDNKLNIKLAKKCRKQLLKSGLPIVSCSLKPLDFGKNIHYKGKRGYLTMFKQIVAALEASDADIVFFCEHDVLYHPSHFDFVPQKEDTFYYNNNVWKWNGTKAVKYDSRWLSQMCCYRKLALEHYEKRVRLIEQGNNKLRFEPGTRRGIDDYKTKYWDSKVPNVDLRHGNNLTGVTRFKLEDFRKKPKNFKERSSIEGWNLNNIL